MRDFFTVFTYTFFENIRRKVIIISTIIMLILTVGLLSAPAIIKYFTNNRTNMAQTDKKNQSNKKDIVYIVDTSGVYKDDITKLSQVMKDYDFKVEPSDKINALKETVKNNKNTSLMTIETKNGVPYFDYWVQQYGSGLNPTELSRTFKMIYSQRLLKAAHVSDQIAGKVMSDISFNIKEIGKGMMKSLISGILITMMLFFAVYMYSYGIAMSVASEKTSRVMELLLTSIKPSRIILGKSAAMGVLGLCQLLIISLAAFITYNLFFPKDFMIAGQTLNFSNFTPLAVMMFIVYFILGYSLYAMMNAVAGATVSKAEDVNAAIMPISMISIIAFYVGYVATITSPDGGFAIAASLIPFSTPFSMPSRLLMSEVPAWQIIISIALLSATITFMAWFSIKMYSSAVLHYGTRLKLADLLKITK